MNHYARRTAIGNLIGTLRHEGEISLDVLAGEIADELRRAALARMPRDLDGRTKKGKAANAALRRVEDARYEMEFGIKEMLEALVD